MGGTAGTAILFSVLFNTIPEALKSAFATPSITVGVAKALADPAITSDPANAAIIEVYKNPAAVGTALDGDTSFLVGANEALAKPFLVGFADATVTVYWIGLGVVLVAFILSWFLKATPLRQKSAMQEAADEDASLLAERAADMMGSMVEPGTATGAIKLKEAEAREAAREAHKAKAEAKKKAKASS
jgi:low affinity Fe/Cu permease